MSNQVMDDVEIRCKQCGETFILRVTDQKCLNGKPLPQYCADCNSARREKIRFQKQAKADAAWQIVKQQEHEKYIEKLKNWNVSLLSDIPSANNDTLCILGNGFDLMHGVRSSYRDFAKTIGKKTPLMFYLKNYLHVDDLWADFENALAKFDAKDMCSSFLIDNQLDCMDAYDEDATAADFFVAAEMAVSPLTTIASELPYRFEKWIRSLTVNTYDRPLKHIIGKGKVLNFNYTEFAEDLYGANPSDICYIHGCRKRRNNQPSEQLILGHIAGGSDVAYDFEDHLPHRNLPGHAYQMIYDAQQTALNYLIAADEKLTKHSQQIIKSHLGFFKNLNNINNIVVIGHSLYPVDWDYFAEIIKHIDNSSATWHIGCFNLSDLQRIEKFAENFNIAKSHIKIFRTDDIKVHINNDSSSDKPTKPNNPRAKILSQSDDKRWEIKRIGRKIQIIDRSTAKSDLTRLFSVYMSGALFDDTCTSLLLIARGIDKGVFLFRLQDNHWRYIKELEGIPNQGVITARLNRVYRDGNTILFVYNNRTMKYNLLNGELIENKSVRKAKDHIYQGVDLTEKFGMHHRY